MLQDYHKSRKGHLVYYVFDLLYFQGHDLTGLPLRDRKALLKKILPASPNIKISDHVAQDGIAFFKVVKDAGLEGIIAKHDSSLYHMGKRSGQWLKIKTHLTQEAVIGGFTEPRGSRSDFGALVLGVFEQNELDFHRPYRRRIQCRDAQGNSRKIGSSDTQKMPFSDRAQDEHAGHLGKTSTGL